LHLYKW
jgi:predicted DNA-binding ribbon-helix-helix protein